MCVTNGKKIMELHTSFPCMQYHQRHFQLRTRETHKSHCSSLEGPLQEHIATTYGLWRDAVLNELAYFHVTEGLVPDVMHDLLEGVLPLCVKFLLKHFVDTGIVHIHELNRRIECFKFGPMDASSRPRGNITSAQLNSGELKQSGKYTGSMHTCMQTLALLLNVLLRISYKVVTFHDFVFLQQSRCGVWAAFSH